MFTQLNSLTFVKVRELPRTKFKLRLRLAFIQLLSANGDGEIRTLDPLLARQVLSQLSYTPIWLFYQYLIFKTLLFDEKSVILNCNRIFVPDRRQKIMKFDFY